MLCGHVARFIAIELEPVVPEYILDLIVRLLRDEQIIRKISCDEKYAAFQTLVKSGHDIRWRSLTFPPEPVDVSRPQLSARLPILLRQPG